MQKRTRPHKTRPRSEYTRPRRYILPRARFIKEWKQCASEHHRARVVRTKRSECWEEKGRTQDSAAYLSLSLFFSLSLSVSLSLSLPREWEPIVNGLYGLVRDIRTGDKFHEEAARPGSLTATRVKTKNHVALCASLGLREPGDRHQIRYLTPVTIYVDKQWWRKTSGRL